MGGRELRGYLFNLGKGNVWTTEKEEYIKRNTLMEEGKSVYLKRQKVIPHEFDDWQEDQNWKR